MVFDNQVDTKKILIVDDSPESIEVLGNALPKNYVRQVALNGNKALKLLAATPTDNLPDLILMDVVLPDMNGYKVCQQLKKEKLFKDIPVIFLSALSEIDDKMKAFIEGGVDYITKPFEIEEIQARVSTHLRLHNLQQEVEKHNHHLEEIVEDKIKEISESQMATIYALAKLTESRDDETGGHIERVQKLCGILAKQLSHTSKYYRTIDSDYIDNIFKTSSLHDIGKVGIPDNILLKPGKLTTEEFDIMKKHTLIGAETLEEVKKSYPRASFVEMGIEIARFHHEKWDGSGYPDGIAGEKIPLSARIMALVDVYDALRSKRSYKEAFSHKKSCMIISESSSKHFEPLIVKEFLNINHEFDSFYGQVNV